MTYTKNLRDIYISLVIYAFLIGVQLATGSDTHVSPAIDSSIKPFRLVLQYESWFIWLREEEEKKGIGYQHLCLEPNKDFMSPLQLITEIKGQMGSGHGIAVHTKIGCRFDSYLSPVDLVVGDPEGEAISYNATVEYELPYGCSAGHIEILSGPKKGEKIPLPPHTVFDSSLPILVERLPFLEGKVFEFNLFEMSRLRVTKGFSIKYCGLEMVDAGYGETKLNRFEVNGPREPGLIFWVDDNHRVIKYVSSAGVIKFIRASQKDALGTMNR